MKKEGITMTIPNTIRKLVCSGAVMLVGIGAIAVAVPTAAQAAGTTNIVGTVTAGGVRFAGASVGVYRWNPATTTTPAQWVWLGYVTKSNSAGNYSINAASGYYYDVLAEYSNNDCALGGSTNYLAWGESAVFLANSTKANAAVVLNQYEPLSC